MIIIIMVSSFDENELIELLLYEFKTNNENYEKILETEINIIVNYNTIGENQEIIVHYIGDVYDAIKLFNKKINKMDIDKYDNKEIFYRDLAYISLYTFLTETIQDLI
jgi:hypothetical protein